MHLIDTKIEKISEDMKNLQVNNDAQKNFQLGYEKLVQENEKRLVIIQVISRNLEQEKANAAKLQSLIKYLNFEKVRLKSELRTAQDSKSNLLEELNIQDDTAEELINIKKHLDKQGKKSYKVTLYEY